MLNVQRFLKSGKTFEDLSQFGVAFKKHPTEDLYILDYDQIESKTDHYISDECRGLVLDSKFNLVSGCMPRFYNIGQVPDSDKVFNWNDFSAREKRDGSMLPIFCYKNDLMIRTRFSWADSIVGMSGKTWKELALECLTEKQKKTLLSISSETFIFELETPWNQVVVYHEKPQVVLLTIIHNHNNKEWPQYIIDQWAGIYNFNRPKEHKFKSIEDAQSYLNQMEIDKNKDEGFVFQDCNGLRKKAKNKYYMMYHSMCTGITSIRQIYDIVSNPNIDKEEVGLYFPHLKIQFEDMQSKIDLAFKKLWDIWFMTQDKKYEEQKKFALAITKPDSEYYTRFSSILFRCRERESAKQPTDFCLREEWANSKDLIFKVLFKE